MTSTSEKKRNYTNKLPSQWSFSPPPPITSRDIALGLHHYSSNNNTRKKPRTRHHVNNVNNINNVTNNVVNASVDKNTAMLPDLTPLSPINGGQKDSSSNPGSSINLSLYAFPYDYNNRHKASRHRFHRRRKSDPNTSEIKRREKYSDKIRSHSRSRSQSPNGKLAKNWYAPSHISLDNNNNAKRMNGYPSYQSKSKTDIFSINQNKKRTKNNNTTMALTTTTTIYNNTRIENKKDKSPGLSSQKEYLVDGDDEECYHSDGMTLNYRSREVWGGSLSRLSPRSYSSRMGSSRIGRERTWQNQKPIKAYSEIEKQMLQSKEEKIELNMSSSKSMICLTEEVIKEMDDMLWSERLSSHTKPSQTRPQVRPATSVEIPKMEEEESMSSHESTPLTPLSPRVYFHLDKDANLADLQGKENIKDGENDVTERDQGQDLEASSIRGTTSGIGTEGIFFTENAGNSAMEGSVSKSKSKKKKSYNLFEDQKQDQFIFLVNMRSGGKKGWVLSKEVAKYGALVFDMLEVAKNSEVRKNLSKILKEYRNRCVVVLCGGDGSIGWGCTLIDKAIAEMENEKIPYPCICSLPMGTGNDFTRSLGWGNLEPSCKNLINIMADIQFCSKITKRWSNVDRWHVSYTFDHLLEQYPHLSTNKEKEKEKEPDGEKDNHEHHNHDEDNHSDSGSHSRLGANTRIPPSLPDYVKEWPEELETYINQAFSPPLPKAFVCYLSLGYDALVAHKFESERRVHPERFNSQFKNQIMYVKHGFTEFFKPSDPINDMVSIQVDGKPVELPVGCRSFKLVNINSAANGVFFWGTGKSRKEELQEWTFPRLDDGKIEVMASKGVHDLLQHKANVSHAHRISQSSDIQIRVKQVPIAMQIDGEAWVIPKPCTLRVRLHSKLPTIVGYTQPRGVESWLQASLEDEHINKAKKQFREICQKKFLVPTQEQAKKEEPLGKTSSWLSLLPTLSSLSPSGASIEEIQQQTSAGDDTDDPDLDGNRDSTPSYVRAALMSVTDDDNGDRSFSEGLSSLWKNWFPVNNNPTTPGAVLTSTPANPTPQDNNATINNNNSQESNHSSNNNDNSNLGINYGSGMDNPTAEKNSHEDMKTNEPQFSYQEVGSIRLKILEKTTEDATKMTTEPVDEIKRIESTQE